MTETGGLTVIGLEAQNVKRIKAIKITPPAMGVVKITGKNASGKSSALDCIMLALGKAEHPAEPIRKGETRARDVVKLATRAGQHLLTVTRTWTGKDSYLTVEQVGGGRIARPREFLDALVGTGLGFDPSEFVTMKPGKQVETLLGLLKLPVDPRTLDREKEALAADRTEVNREVKALQARLGAMTVPSDETPDEEVSVSALMEERDELIRVLNVRDKAERVVATLRSELMRAKDHHLRATEKVSELRKALEAAKEDETLSAQLLDFATRDFDNAEKDFEAMPVPDLAPITDRLKSAEGLNRSVRAKQEHQSLVTLCKNKASVSDSLTDEIERLDSVKTRCLATAAFPVEGLGFGIIGGDYCVTFNGVPLEQAAASEQLRVGMAIAMATNPDVRVILLREGSMLDADTLAGIEALAAQTGYQVWTEIVGEGDASSFVIEEGQILSAPSRQVTS